MNIEIIVTKYTSKVCSSPEGTKGVGKEMEVLNNTQDVWITSLLGLCMNSGIRIPGENIIN